VLRTGAGGGLTFGFASSMLEFLAWHYWSLCVAAPCFLLSGRAEALALRVWGGPASPERVICRIFLLITISHCAWRQLLSFVRACGAAGASCLGRSCFRLSELCVGFSCLTLLATVRGGTSFLFPTAKKKRSKENAYKRQLVASALAHSRPWSECRTVPANPRAAEHPSCFSRHCTLRPHGPSHLAVCTTSQSA
jgi:hypothetical protein